MFDKIKNLNESFKLIHYLWAPLLLIISHFSGLHSKIINSLVGTEITRQMVITLITLVWILIFLFFLCLIILVVHLKLRKQVFSINKDEFEFISHCGIYKHKESGRYYCPNCLDNENRKSILSASQIEREFTCICGQKPPNPDFEPPSLATGQWA